MAEPRKEDDRDQEVEQAGEDTPHNRRAYDDTRGASVEDVDPDSAESDVERDDTVAD